MRKAFKASAAEQGLGVFYRQAETLPDLIDFIAVFQIMHHVVDNFLSDCRAFVDFPHFLNFAFDFFHRDGMSIGNLVNPDNDKAVIGFGNLTDFADIVRKCSVDKFGRLQNLGVGCRRFGIFSVFAQTFDIQNPDAHFAGNIFQRGAAADFVFNFGRNGIGFVVSAFLFQRFDNLSAGFSLVCLGTGLDVGNFHDMPAQIGFCRSGNFSLSYGEDVFGHVGNQQVFGNIPQICRFLVLPGRFLGNGIKVLAAFQFGHGFVGIFSAVKNHLQNLACLRRFKLTDVFFIIGFNVSLFRNDFFGHVVYRQYDEGNVAFFGFDKIGAEVFIILFGFFRRNFAVNFNLCRVNDNVFKSLLLAFDFGQPVGQNFRNVHVDGRILNQLLLNNVLFQGVDIALLGPAGSGQDPAQAFQAEIAVGVQKFRLRINDFAHQIVADVHVQLVCRSLNDGVGKLALNQSL